MICEEINLLKAYDSKWKGKLFILDLKAGMVIELRMKASYHGRKKMVTQKFEIEDKMKK
ncbi:hypothetical protein G3A_17530 [Bacillus sp. 17376]|uniref:Uncharacterized protein n=1 Tax=Mesobacillus boroniphilus JCM 21738 TaxID=1294265 RepID=W4RXQ6_9BACI|nr:hypothetical protein [Mesobacillus boroniphilus]ESU31289.1 hypothetical protein G3A_17530 [Bacillus sp. 17376]GAE48414.1 hypothetical protein JCM21738_5532 [Mesobacillus boroniphilus JCM 21738]